MGRSGSKVRARAGNAGVVRASASPHEILERPIIRRAKIEFIHFPKPGADGEIDWIAAANKDDDATGFDHPVGVYTIAKALDLETRRRTIIKGAFGPVSTGETVVITDGEWREQKNFPPYFYVRAIELQPPATREDLIYFLGHLPGVGDKLAERIVDHLDNGKGLDAQTMLEKIDRDPEILLQVPGITMGKFGDKESLVSRWEEIRGYERDLLFLSSLGVSQYHMDKIVHHLGRGGNMIEAIKQNPYVLCEVPGIPFDFADHIARKFHIFVEDPRRLAHGIEYVLNAAEEEGMVSLNRKQLMAMAPSLLGVDGLKPDVQKVRDAVDKLIENGLIISEQVDGEERLYSREQWTIETRIYRKLDEILNAAPLKQRRLRKPADSFLTDEQWSAVKRGVNSRLSILTGNPGVGKTSSLKELLDTFDGLGMNYVCLAPTGRAAKRMEEQTGRPASTIHRKLGYSGLATPKDVNDEPVRKLASLGMVLKDSDTPGMLDAEEVPIDAVVIDESSMVSQRMFERLLSHVGHDTRLVFVGDSDQLPPVEAGAPLLDMIASKRVPTTRLTKIFRQAEDSLLVVNAHRIKDGKTPVTKRQAEKELGHKLKEDLRVVDTSPETVIDDIHREVEKIARQLRVDETEVMVIAPLKSGDAGVHALNRALQAKHNPDGVPVFENEEQQFRVGDIVMNTKNRYVSMRQSENGMHDIFNGDIGRIIGQDEETKEVFVDFGHGEQSYGVWELPNLDLAYCSTTHKMQGSEAPAVVYVVPPGGTDRLTRQNVYTGITRAKQRCVVLANRETLERGIAVDASVRDQQLQLDKTRLTALNEERSEAYEAQQARYADWAERSQLPTPEDHVRAEDVELALA